MTTVSEQLTNSGASCLIYRDAPSWNSRNTASVGAFRCESATAGADLLNAAAELLRREDFKALIGPMDGDTWHSYRLVAETDGSPPFLMEPVSGAHDHAAFTSAGFAPISDYVSARASLDDAIGDGPSVKMDGITVTPWDGLDVHALIGGMFAMSAERFSKNAFFKPITQTEFLTLYEPILPRIDPRLVLFARDESGLVGFLFGLPNLAEGKDTKTVIVKTYASEKRGVGHLLLDRVHRIGCDLGFDTVIHALMHVENISLERSKRHAGKIFRRYALMGKNIA